MLLAIDPSINSCGIAVFDQSLVFAKTIRVKPDTKLDIAERCRFIALEVFRTVKHFWVLEIAHEWPQIYKSDTPARANSVITMAAVNLAIDTLLLGCQTNSYLPAEIWGQLPKSKTGSAWASPRGKRIKSRLSEAELKLVPDQHDVVDAVGIGLHHLGRLGIRHVNVSG